MSKRRLSERQKARVRSIQERHSISKSNTNEGLVIAHYGASVDIEDSNQTIYHCQIRQNISTLVPGDRVHWQASSHSTGVVVALLPRESVLERIDQSGKTKIIAANLDTMIITIAPIPAFSTYLLDRYLLAAENSDLEAIIILNKTDLLSKHDFHDISKTLLIYEELGYSLLFVSVNEEKGLKELASQLTQKTVVFVGQSGVGKSSLISELIPHEDVKTGKISELKKLGRHTTTTSQLYHLKSDGNVIDSPGVREFEPGKLDYQMLIKGFKELHALQGQCKFRNCTHRDEPGCIIKQAVSENQISKIRLESFHKLLESAS